MPTEVEMSVARASRPVFAALLTIALVAVVAAVVSTPSGATSGSGAVPPTFVEFGGLAPGSSPTRITAGADGNLWFTAPGADMIGRMTTAGAVTEFSVPTPAASPAALVAGPGGDVWFVEQAAAKVASITPAGAVTEIALAPGASPAGIAAGPDGNLWVTEPGAHAVASVTPGGTVTIFPLVDPAATPTDITVGGDGNLWFTETHGHFVARLTTAGVITEFSVPAVAGSGGITAGADGNVWFGETGTGGIGRMTPAGALTEFAAGTAAAPVTAVTKGADGNVWYAQPGSDQIGLITPPGAVTPFAVPNHLAPAGVAVGSDHNVWFTVPGSNLIGQATGGSSGATTTTSTSTSSTSTSTTSTTSTTIPVSSVPVIRLAGADRIATAIAISANRYPTAGSAKAVVLASAFGSFADALAGSPLAAAKGGPLLLSGSSALDPRTDSEITRVLPPGGTVYVLGGSSALGLSIDAGLEAAGYTVTRLAGADRFATAVMIADAGLGNPTKIYEATGLDFPDAISAAAVAAVNQGAILLTNGAVQAPATAAYLAAHPGARRWAVGGQAVAADPGATPVAGPNRWVTNADADALVGSPPAVGVASGLSAPDALTGGAAIGSSGGPLVLVDPLASALPSATAAWLGTVRGSVGGVKVYGGKLVVPAVLVTAVTAAL